MEVASPPIGIAPPIREQPEFGLEGVNADTLFASYADRYTLKKSSELGPSEKLEREERFMHFASSVMHNCAVTDKSVALQLSLPALSKPESLLPLQRFVKEAIDRKQIFDAAPNVMGVYLPQLQVVNERDSTVNPFGAFRTDHYQFTESDSKIDPNRLVCLGNQLGFDLGPVMLGMRAVKYSLMNERSDRRLNDDRQVAMDELVHMPLRHFKMQMSQLAVKARMQMDAWPRVEAAQRNADPELHANLPEGALLSVRLKADVFVPVDEARAHTSVLFGCCHARCPLTGTSAVDQEDALLEFTIGQALQDPSMRWLREYRKDEPMRAKDDPYGYAEGRDDFDRRKTKDPATGNVPGTALEPPWIARGQPLGSFNPDGVTAVFVPYASHSVTAASIPGGQQALGSLITTKMTPEGVIEARRLRTPVGVFFVNARGHVLDRAELKDGGVVLPPSPKQPGLPEDLRPHNLFLFQSGANVMLSMAVAADFDGTVFLSV